LFSKNLNEEKVHLLSVNEKHRIYEAFKNLNDKPQERMGELKLFRNQVGRVVHLKNLLKETDIHWLKSYCIDPNEYRSGMSYFQDTKQIYSHIVHPFWSDIAESISLKPDQAANVLNQIQEFYNQADEKSSLSDKKLVFFSGGMKECDSILYHPKLAEWEVEDYGVLQNLLFRYFQMVLPDQWCLPFLAEEPFQRESSRPDFLEDRIVLKKEELMLLLRFCYDAEINFFQHRLVREEEGQFWLESTGELVNCQTNNEKLVNYVQEHYSNYYVSLPESLKEIPLSPEKKGKVLIDHLMEDFIHSLNDEQAKLQFTDALLLEAKEHQKAWFQTLDKVTLGADWKDEKSNEVYLKWLANLFDVLDAQDRKMIWEKLFLQDDAKEIHLESIHQTSDVLTLQKEERDYKISLSQLLNSTDQAERKQIHAFADESMKRGLLNEDQARYIFKLDGAEAPPLYDFLVTLEDHQLTNAHQLAFVLLYTEFDKNSISEYKVQNQNGEWQSLKGSWFYTDVSHDDLLDPQRILHERYQDLRGIINLPDFQSLRYGTQNDDLILARFLFEEGCDPDVFKSGLDVISVLDYLYHAWERNQPNNHSKTEADWQRVLGFNPNHKVYSRYALSNENVSEEIKDWVNGQSNKVALTAAIGIQTEQAEVVKLREALWSGETHFAEENLKSIPTHLLVNSLLGLIRGFKGVEEIENPLQFEKEDSRIPLILSVQQVLAAHQDNDYPSLVHHSNDQLRLLDPLMDEPYWMDEELREKLESTYPDQLNSLYETVPILFHYESLEAAYQAVFSALRVHFHFLSQSSVEEDEPFYPEWKEKHRLRLYKVPALQFELSAQLPSGDLSLGNISKGDWYSCEGEDHITEIHYAHELITLGVMVQQMNEKGDANAFAMEEFKRESESVRKVLVESHGGDELKALLKKSYTEKQRLNFLDKMRNSTKYSHAWFMAYLSYLNSFQEIANGSKQKSLFFQQAKKHLKDGKDSQKFFYLKEAGQSVSDSIEHFEDFEIHIQYKDKSKEKIRVEGVTKKGQDLLVYSRKELPLEFIQKLGEVKKAEIRFSPVLDLMNRLKKSFGNADYIKPWHYPEENLPNLHFIYGPPGTGKTTELKKRILNEIKRKDPKKPNKPKRILVLTPTNKAADVLTKKIKDEKEDTKIYRIGSCPDGEMDLPEDIYQSSLDLELMNEANVIVSTIHRLPYFTVQTDSESIKLFELDNYWDHIIFPLQMRNWRIWK
jgi:hypothetical protein